MAKYTIVVFSYSRYEGAGAPTVQYVEADNLDEAQRRAEEAHNGTCYSDTECVAVFADWQPNLLAAMEPNNILRLNGNTIMVDGVPYTRRE